MILVRWFAGAAFAASALMLSGCGPPLPPVQDYATFTGKVLDATSGAPISGAVVSISVVSSSPTGADGIYKVYPVPTGPYSSVTASAPNYQTFTDNAGGTLTPGQTMTLDIRMQHS